MKIGIGIVGMPGSGKSIFTEAARELGIPILVMGDAVREETLRRGLELSSENVLSVAVDLRKKHGKEAIALLVVRKIEREGIMDRSNVVVIEGLRSPEERDRFLKFFDRFVIVAIHASPRTRYLRIRQRRRLDDAQSIEMLRRRDEKELDFGIGRLLAMADIHLVNENKTKEEFIAECRRTIEKILEEADRN